MNGPTTTAITGKDVLVLAGRLILGLADGDNSALTHPNELFTVKTGKDGNSLYAYNATGQQGELVVRLVSGCSDDVFLNGLLKLMQADPAAFPLMPGQLVKRIGNGLGLVRNDTVIMLGGVFSKQVDRTSNAEGNTDQAVSVYTIRFGNVFRAIL
jgi:hypothetical protein